MTHLPRADAVRAEWRKSSYSKGDADLCVEVAPFHTKIALRDSKDPSGGAFLFSAAEWQSLTKALKG